TAAQLDWWLLLSVAGLIAIGVVLVWSATYSRDDLTGGDSNAYLGKQAVNIGIGAVLGGIIAVTDRRRLRFWAPVIYGGSVLGLALVFVPGIGATVNGSRSWLQLGGMSMQPAELAKIGMILGMALVLAERAEGGLRRGMRDSDLVPALVIAAVPALLVLGQPDLGTLLVFVAIIFGMLAMAGTAKRWLVAMIAAGVAAVLLALATGVLQKYQLLRFEAFTNPALDPRGAGYNTIQARIAVGNGGIFG